MSTAGVWDVIGATTAYTFGQAPHRRQIRPGAFRKACRPDRCHGLPALMVHDPKRQVGVLLGLREDLQRRVLLCRIALSGELGERLAWELQERPDEWGISIHPYYIDKHVRSANGVLYIDTIPRLLEVSFGPKYTSWSPAPRNPQTRILRRVA